MAYLSQVRAVLMDVLINGAVVVPVKKVLWLLGWKQDREGAWAALLDEWVALGQPRNALHGMAVYDKLVLSMAPSDPFARVADWE